MLDFWGIDFGGTNLRMAQVHPETGELMTEPFLQEITHITENMELTDLILSQLPDRACVGITFY